MRQLKRMSLKKSESLRRMTSWQFWPEYSSISNRTREQVVEMLVLCRDKAGPPCDTLKQHRANVDWQLALAGTEYLGQQTSRCLDHCQDSLVIRVHPVTNVVGQ